MSSDPTDRMSFGVFIAPHHPLGQNPTLALERDLDLVVRGRGGGTGAGRGVGVLTRGDAGRDG